MNSCRQNISIGNPDWPWFDHESPKATTITPFKEEKCAPSQSVKARKVVGICIRTLAGPESELSPFSFSEDDDKGGGRQKNIFPSTRLENVIVESSVHLDCYVDFMPGPLTLQSIG